MNRETLDKIEEIFSWQFATSINCKFCGEIFVQENNLVEEDE